MSSFFFPPKLPAVTMDAEVREATHPPLPYPLGAQRGGVVCKAQRKNTKQGVKKRTGVGQEVRHVKRFQPSVCAVRELEEEAEQRVKKITIN